MRLRPCRPSPGGDLSLHRRQCGGATVGRTQELRGKHRERGGGGGTLHGKEVEEQRKTIRTDGSGLVSGRVGAAAVWWRDAHTPPPWAGPPRSHPLHHILHSAARCLSIDPLSLYLRNLRYMAQVHTDRLGAGLRRPQLRRVKKTLAGRYYQLLSDHAVAGDPPPVDKKRRIQASVGAPVGSPSHDTTSSPGVGRGTRRQGNVEGDREGVRVEAPTHSSVRFLWDGQATEVVLEFPRATRVGW